MCSQVSRILLLGAIFLMRNGYADGAQVQQSITSEAHGVVGRNLTFCEKEIITKVSRGEPAWCGRGRLPSDSSYDPEKSAAWNSDRNVDARIIEWLFRSKKES